MFRKTLAIAAVIGMAFAANVSTASAHYNGGYHKHKIAAWGGLPVYKIRHKLRNRGYRKINFYDRRLPVYKARACRNGKRFNLRINRWGKVMWRTRIGWCGNRFHLKKKFKKKYYH